ncbi:MAG: SEC-C domain-containing protein, partial [Eggerthellaceae bacterium]|nr:SEC-C domain-containing protein [Eggerthellaceae bacterium]
VNDRFRVVEGFTLDYSSPIDDVKSSLVAHELWENVEIIDDFVRDNPQRLSPRCLDLARSWKNALPGFYTLVRYQSGRALLMGEAGVFSVCGVTYELEHEIGKAPAYVETVLLPFEDTVVYDGFLQAYDTDHSAAELQRIQDEFENCCAKGIALTGEDFTKRAEAFLAEKRDRELDALLDDVARESAGDEVLPQGFHRGPLAGLSPGEREAAVQERMVQIASALAPSRKDFDCRARKHEPESSLAGCLMLMTKIELESIAQVLGMGGLSKLRKSEMVEELAAELPAALPVLEARLLFVSDKDYRLARKVAGGQRVTFGPEEIKAHAFEWPMEPYTFMFRGSEGYTVLVPDELLPSFAAVDFDELDRMRRQTMQALSVVDACTTMCGVASLDDVYDQYRALVADVIERADFDALVESEAMTGQAGFDFWTYLPSDYVVHYTLGADYLAQEYTRSQRSEIGELFRNVETGEISRAPFERFIDRARADLASELEWLEQYKRDLVESQKSLPMKPLSRTLLENDLIGELLDDPNCVRLRAYFDAHVPDGEDDYAFADRMVEEIAMSSIESGSLQEIFAYLMDRGFDRLANQDDRLTLLVTNVFNAMPSWENNGWSPQELYEQVTGRKMFFNEDGTVKKVGPGEPCPCGSGKQYRDCCGR